MEVGVVGVERLSKKIKGTHEHGHNVMIVSGKEAVSMFGRRCKGDML